MNNMQLLTIIITILVPNMGIWFYLMKHSKELGTIEGALFKELNKKIIEEKSKVMQRNKGEKND